MTHSFHYSSNMCRCRFARREDCVTDQFATETDLLNHPIPEWGSLPILLPILADDTDDTDVDDDDSGISGEFLVDNDNESCDNHDIHYQNDNHDTTIIIINIIIDIMLIITIW